MTRLLLALVLVLYVSGCVTAPLVDFGDRDQPFVNIQLDSGKKDSKKNPKKTEREHRTDERE